jgi:hypothetical protein
MDRDIFWYASLSLYVNVQREILCSHINLSNLFGKSEKYNHRQAIIHLADHYLPTKAFKNRPGKKICSGLYKEMVAEMALPIQR